MEDKMATYRECCFPICTNQYKIKVTFIGFRGVDRLNRPPLDPSLPSTVLIERSRRVITTVAGCFPVKFHAPNFHLVLASVVQGNADVCNISIF